MKLLPSLSSGAFWTGLSLFVAPLLLPQTYASDSGVATLEAAKSPRFEDFAKPAAFEVDSRIPLTFSLPNGDEIYNIVVDSGPRHRERPSCSEEDLAHVTVNDQTLAIATIDTVKPETTHLIGSVQVHDTKSGKQRSVNVILDPKCYTEEVGEEQNETVAEPHLKPHPSKSTTPVFGIRLFLIVDIEGKPWTENAFNISSRLVNGVTAVTKVISPDSPEGEERIFTDYSSISSGQDEESDLDAAESEIHKLSRLRNELKNSEAAVKKQEEIVNSLLGNAHQQIIHELKACGISDPSCIFTTLFKRGKDCFDLLILRFKLHSFGSSSDPCYGMSHGTEPTRAKVLALTSEKCSSRMRHGSSSPHHQGYQALADHEPTRHSHTHTDPEFPGSVEIVRSYDRTHKLHQALGIVASALCLTCIVGLLHRRCCTPQARAERANRRAERRARRQYRCAARRQAIRDWWSQQQERVTRRGRRDPRDTDDYEEKRALILQQEEVLEHVMQQEIEKLRRQAREARGAAVDDVLAMVEEGRAGPSSRSSSSERHASSERPPSVTDTLPPYRSRASSGRPPSYNEFDQHPRSRVNEEFSRYAPTGFGSVDGTTTHTDDETRSLRSIPSLRSFRTNTPASSVVSLSPRTSSETLRTERSVF